jgi:hypothetical protein
MCRGDNRMASCSPVLACRGEYGRNHPLQAIRTIVERDAGGTGTRVRRALFADWAIVDRREAVRAMLLLGIFCEPLGATSDGTPEFDLLFRWFVVIGADGAA